MEGLSEQSIVEMKSHFDAVDSHAGSSGFLDAEQLRKAISTLNKAQPHKYQEATDHDVAAFVDYYTGSGGNRRAINFSEFLYLMAKRSNDSNDNGSLRSAFNEFDADDNGYVNTAELRAVLGKLGRNKMSEVEIDSLVRVGDANEDGVLDFEVEAHC